MKRSAIWFEAVALQSCLIHIGTAQPRKTCLGGDRKIGWQPVSVIGLTARAD